MLEQNVGVRKRRSVCCMRARLHAAARGRWMGMHASVHVPFTRRSLLLQCQAASEVWNAFLDETCGDDEEKRQAMREERDAKREAFAYDLGHHVSKEKTRKVRTEKTVPGWLTYVNHVSADPKTRVSEAHRSLLFCTCSSLHMLNRGTCVATIMLRGAGCKAGRFCAHPQPPRAFGPLNLSFFFMRTPSGARRECMH
eukprot:1064203-Pelagomonas_calceolata.AAC.3